MMFRLGNHGNGSRYVPGIRFAEAPGGGQDADPHSLAKQRTFTDGRVVVHGNADRLRRSI